MKIVLTLFLVCIVKFSTGKLIIPTLIDSIDDFKASHPGATLVELDIYDHILDGSRSYSLGSRQTGD